MKNDEINFVAAEAAHVTIDGVEVIIAPLTVKPLMALIRAVEPFLSTLLYEAQTLDPARVLTLLGTHGDNIIQAVAICTGREVAWIEQLLPDRLVVLVLKAVEVNQDFFTRALPMLKAAAPKVAPTLASKIMAMPWAGQTPSTS